MRGASIRPEPELYSHRHLHDAFSTPATFSNSCVEHTCNNEVKELVVDVFRGRNHGLL